MADIEEVSRIRRVGIKFSHCRRPGQPSVASSGQVYLRQKLRNRHASPKTAALMLTSENFQSRLKDFYRRRRAGREDQQAGVPISNGRHRF